MGRLFFISVVMLGVLLVAKPAVAQDIFPIVEPPGETRTLGTNEFAPPVWMAVIADGKGSRLLAGAGDPIFRGGESGAVGVVKSVELGRLRVAPMSGGKAVLVSTGKALPHARDLVFREAILVKTLEYRHRVVARSEPKTLDGELYLLDVRGSRAILQRDIDPPPSPTEVMEKRLAAIQIVEAGPQTWEVSARDVQVAMESGEAIITSALRDSRIDISRDLGVGLEVKTSIVGARLDRRGFVITTPNLASRAGLRVGDRILKVNDVPIDGYGSLIQVYRKIKNDSLVSTVLLIIERDGKPLSLTYRVR